MIFKGIVEKLLPQRSGKSEKTGNEWKAQPFIFKYFEPDNKRFPDRVVLETMNSEYIEKLKEGLPVKIGFGHRVNEWKEKYYNELTIYHFEALVQEKAGEQDEKKEKNDNEQANDEDDLPF